MDRRGGRGGPGAFRALFDRHAPSVRRFLRDLGRDEAYADEGTQETFVRAHARLATLRDDQRLRPWLLGIARRVFLEEMRRRRPRAEVDEVAAAVPSPETDLLIAEEARLFRAALLRLPPTRRGVRRRPDTLLLAARAVGPEGFDRAKTAAAAMSRAQELQFERAKASFIPR